MNWYKKINGSRFIKLPEEIEGKIDLATQDIVDYYFSNKSNKEISEKLFFISPYDQKEYFIPVVMFPHDVYSNSSEEIASFNPQHRNINVFPYNHPLRNVNSEKLFHYIRPFIYHELSHAIDPKFLIPNWWRSRNKIDYLKREEEFDAYSKQIEITIKQNLNKNNFEEFINWISSSDISIIPSYLSYFRDMLIEWNANKPVYIKKLRQRLYNSFVGDINYEE